LFALGSEPNRRVPLPRSKLPQIQAALRSLVEETVVAGKRLYDGVTIVG